jgi:glutathione S-transferase
MVGIDEAVGAANHGGPVPAVGGGLQLIGNLICPFSKRAHIMLNALGARYSFHELDFTDKPPWLAALNPEAKIPVLLDGDCVIFESRSILEYLNDQYDQRFLPGDAALRAVARGWCQTVQYIHEDVRAYFLAQAQAPFVAAYERICARLALLCERCPPSLMATNPLSLVGVYLAGLFAILEVLELGPHRFVPEAGPLRELFSELTSHPAVLPTRSAAYRDRLLLFLAERNGLFSQDARTQSATAHAQRYATERNARGYLSR